MFNVHNSGGSEELVGYGKGISILDPVYTNCIAYDVQTTSSNESFELCCLGSGNIDWGDNSDDDVSFASFTTKSHTYTTTGTYTIVITGNITRFQAGSTNVYRANVKTIHTMDLSGYTGAGKFALMAGEFYNCINATLGLNFSLSNDMTNMYGTFGYCYGLMTAPVIPDGVIDLWHTFYNCNSLTTLPVIPSGVINLTSIFSGCTDLISINNIWPEEFTASNIDISYMFYRANEVIGIPTGTLPANLLWAHPDAATKFNNTTNAFKNCTSLTNYNDIPESWGGPAT